MTRHDAWEKRLNAVVAKHQLLPGEWGVSDCWMMTMDAMEAVTGQRILTHLQKYRTEAAGYRAFRKAGFVSHVGEALASVLQEVPAALARRGDVGTIDRAGQISTGVFTSIGLAVRTIYGHVEKDGRKRIEVVTGADVQFFPASEVRQAFRVM